MSIKSHPIYRVLYVCPSNRATCMVITARNEVGARLCFHTCLWFCSRGGGWYTSMPCRSWGSGWWYPSMPCRFPAPHPGGSLRGLAGGVSRPTPEGVSRPTPGRGGLQAHTQGGCIPACTEADTPPTATAAGSTHPTGMHSCYIWFQYDIISELSLPNIWQFPRNSWLCIWRTFCWNFFT